MDTTMQSINPNVKEKPETDIASESNYKKTKPENRHWLPCLNPQKLTECTLHMLLIYSKI